MKLFGKFFNKRLAPSKEKGFTLIELLVVIAVLSVLAAGVLSAINPAKRIAQANDARVKNDIGQIAQAEQVYYTSSAGAGGAPHYTATAADLVSSNDLKSEPKDPAGVIYTIILKPAACTTTAKSCTEIAISHLKYDQPSGGAVRLCWDSTNGKMIESPSAPVAGVATCP